MQYNQCHSCHKLISNKNTGKNKHHCGLGRKRKKRLVNSLGKIKHLLFKPQGIPQKELKTIVLSPAEIQAIKFKNIAGLQQTEIAKKMAISQSTLARLLNEANKKIAVALINGYGIKLNNN